MKVQNHYDNWEENEDIALILKLAILRSRKIPTRGNGERNEKYKYLFIK